METAKDLMDKLLDAIKQSSATNAEKIAILDALSEFIESNVKPFSIELHNN